MKIPIENKYPAMLWGLLPGAGFILLLFLLATCGEFPPSGGGPEPVEYPTSDGTQTAPLALNYPGSLPHEGIVAQTPSYYRITGLVAGNEYELSMTDHSSSVSFQPFQDNFVTPATCFATETVAESSELFRCGFTAIGNSLWLKTTNLNAPTTISSDPRATTLPQDYFYTYSLQVKQIAPPKADGSISAPMQLQPNPYMPSMSYRGTVGAVGSVNNGSSYYQINGLNSGPYHVVRLWLISADVDLFVYPDAFISPFTCAYTVLPDTQAEHCSVSISGQSMWVEVRIPAGTTTFSRGPTFTFKVGPGG